MILSTEDISHIVYDLLDVSIFFDFPISIQIQGRTIEVGKGLGGFSWSLFQRGADCNSCGNCCKHTFRDLWFWWDSEPHRPEGLEPIVIQINRVPTTLWLHRNEMGADRCDFLVDAKDGDRDVGYCALHAVPEKGNIKPAHCHAHPLTGVYLHPGRQKYLLNRRLPPRNWRWPNCPIKPEQTPYQVKDLLDDQYILTSWVKALMNIPGNRAREMFDRWFVEATKSLCGDPTRSSIWFD
jgi:hypothetical protein